MPVIPDLKKIIRDAEMPLLSAFLFFVIGIGCIVLTRHSPVKDFGNYYYGSRLLLDGRFTSGMYTGLDYFNRQIAAYGETNFLENYIPVPPFSAVFYVPFCLFSSLPAKLLFNLLGLLLFCFSFCRLLRYYKLTAKSLLLVPVLFIYPVCNNMLQGQAYLLISALLMELFMSSEKGKIIYPSVLTALVILLKISPVILLAYFILKKNYKIVLCTLGCVVLFSGISVLCLGSGIVSYYITGIVPRLFNNEIIGPYYYSNQSVYTALLNLFSYDAINNPGPITNHSFLVPVVDAAFSVCVLLVLFALRKENNFLFFSFVVFGMLLLGRYNPTYAMLYLLPLAIALAAEQKRRQLHYMILACIALSVSMPTGSLAHFSFLLQFARLEGLLIVFLLCVYYYQVKISYKVAALVFIPVFALRWLSFPVLPAAYFPVQNTKGILYDISINGDAITFISTLGSETAEEEITIKGTIRTDSSLVVKHNCIYYKNRLLCDSKDNKCRPFIYNDTSLVFMSDLNQGLRFYKLRTIPLVK